MHVDINYRTVERCRFVTGKNEHCAIGLLGPLVGGQGLNEMRHSYAELCAKQLFCVRQYKWQEKTATGATLGIGWRLNVRFGQKRSFTKSAEYGAWSEIE